MLYIIGSLFLVTENALSDDLSWWAENKPKENKWKFIYHDTAMINNDKEQQVV